ncbi:MAG TPA: class I adenylate-forming enzyme family protein [Candidatus Deferrimicrobium sp.]|nr:class I adenylate-forming enzyme family protein [Candidatus Deferrimicrobium sp.]
MRLSPFYEAIAIKAKYLPRDYTAIVYGTKKITWFELHERITRLGNGLRNLGIKKGDKVAILFHNSPEFVEANVAIQGLGAIPVPVNYRYVASELEYLLENSDSICLIFEEEALPVVEEVRKKILIVKNYICQGNTKHNNYIDYEEFIASCYNIDLAVRGHLSTEDVALICYTGGTTGRSKGVMLSYNSIQYNQEAVFNFLMHVLPSAKDVDLDIFAKNEFERKIESAAGMFGGFIFDFMNDPDLRKRVFVYEAPLRHGPGLPPITLATKEGKLKFFTGKPKHYDAKLYGHIGEHIRDFVNLMPYKFTMKGRVELLPKLVWRFLLGGIKVSGPLEVRLALIRALMKTPKASLMGGLTMLIIPPLFHLASYALFLMQWLYTGSPVVFPASMSFDPQETLELIERENVAFLFLVPTMWKRLLEQPDIEKYDLSSLKVAVTGAALMPGKVKKKLLKYFPNAMILDAFGQTEMAPVTSIKLSAEEDKVKDRSVGQTLKGIEVRIVDEEGIDIKDGEIGELWYRGPTIMKGYYKDEEKTKAVIDADGWFHSGDLAYRGPDGEIYTVECKKECINTGGEKVFPLEVEEVILEHPKVDNVCVIGVPNEEWGETIRAIVVPRSGVQDLTEGEIIEWCVGKVAGYKKPRSVIFTKKLPLSPVGKVMRAKIREEFGKP